MLFRRWGVTDDETGLVYGCDALVPEPGMTLWRGVTVQAPDPTVWSWVRMLRRAPYSYDLVDNFGRRSPRTLEDLPEPAPGDRGLGFGRVVAVVQGEEVTYRIGATWISYRLVPAGATTRLLFKAVLPKGLATTLLRPVLPLGDLVMARKQLLTLKALAEG